MWLILLTPLDPLAGGKELKIFFESKNNLFVLE